MNEWMRRSAMRISAIFGSPWSIAAALIAVGSLMLWMRVRGYSQELLWTFASWLTVVTFIMVFILQNAQNRHDRALQLKLDELLRAVEGARTQMVNLQGMSETDLEKLEADFKQLREQERRKHGALKSSAAQTGVTAADNG
ncbi:MAG: putative small integral rane protein [Phycisphaerales bacterium]|nr:putative small integral rane protein [Phycisphaerales bacterium]